MEGARVYIFKAQDQTCSMKFEYKYFLVSDELQLLDIFVSSRLSLALLSKYYLREKLRGLRLRASDRPRSPLKCRLIFVRGSSHIVMTRITKDC